MQTYKAKTLLLHLNFPDSQLEDHFDRINDLPYCFVQPFGDLSSQEMAQAAFITGSLILIQYLKLNLILILALTFPSFHSPAGTEKTFFYAQSTLMILQQFSDGFVRVTSQNIVQGIIDSIIKQFPRRMTERGDFYVALTNQVLDTDGTNLPLIKPEDKRMIKAMFEGSV